MGIAILIGLAFIFYRVGESDYGKGWLLALASILASFVGSTFFGFLGTIVANVLLFIGLLVYNLFAKKPPGSQSGL